MSKSKTHVCKPLSEMSEDEIRMAERVAELENRDQKEDQLRKMAWIAMGSMIAFTVAMFLPFVPESRVSLLGDILSMFYVAQAGVVATFFGSSAYMSKHQQPANTFGGGGPGY